MRLLIRWVWRRIHAKPYPPRKLLRLLRWYPPFLFQRVIPLALSDDFLTVHVKVRRSLLTRNLWGSFFGGTILSAVDPWFGLLLWQKCFHEGIPLEVWVERMEIRFLRAGVQDLYFTCTITPTQWEEIAHQLRVEGKLRYTFSYQIYEKGGEMCAEGTQVLYLRNLARRPRQKPTPVLFS
ncbi:MAG: DUF4442 domain-containing protein [Bacteroidia bacterium]|nr:DUF4442 domain-containing protein [Bacteroidia bacterium]